MTKKIFIGLLVVLSSSAMAMAGAGGLFGSRKPEVRAEHTVHAQKEISCDKCHTLAASSRWASDRNVPGMEQCRPCHAEAKRRPSVAGNYQECYLCHVGRDARRPPRRGLYEQPRVRYSHRAHEKLPCKSCHPAAAAVAPTAFSAMMPTMRQCYECHRREGAGTDCRRCHLVRRDGTLISQLDGVTLRPPGWLFGPNHGPDWSGTHGRMAGRNSSLCGSCHREAFCQDCHMGKRPPQNVHPGDWMTTHGVNTRMDNPHCRGCHRKQSFCLTCHRRAGVAPDSPASTRPESSSQKPYHGDKTPAQICRRAKFSITSCVSCHSESSCVSCHATINPHPAGFKRRCKMLAKKNHRACRKCHVGSIEERCN